MLSSTFLATLHAAVADLRATTHTQFASCDLALLQQRPTAASWSILECLEHLNCYSRYYNPTVANALAQARPTAAFQAEVAYSWLGRKSVALMQPSNTKKQTTLKRMNPQGKLLGWEVLTEFDEHQVHLLALLDQACTADLNRKVIPVEFLYLLKLRLGEALEFVVVHQQRHVQQALRIQEALRLELAC